MTNNKNVNRMTSGERNMAFTLAGVLTTRMLGLFMVLPVFAVYVRDLQGYTATLAGLAVGIYGLTQAVLKISLGRLSDRLGRKSVILGGLLFTGNVVAAMSHPLQHRESWI